MKIKRILTGLMPVVGVSNLTNAAEYTVAKDGNDSNVGTNETPFRTIFALTLAGYPAQGLYIIFNYLNIVMLALYFAFLSGDLG